MLPRRLDCFLDWLPASAACHSLSRCVPAVPTITLAPGAASGQATLFSSQSVDYNPVTGRPAPRSSQSAMRLLFVAFLLASLRLLSTPAPSMTLRYTSSQLIRLNHRVPPSLDITSTLQQHCLVRRRPYIHRGSHPCAAHTGLVPTTSAYVIRALIT
uniref:Secreted protein n=1 Tax=Knipowitschia caucasica TaxID=637954 RepID=A0AAV2J9G2_KNICA